MKIMKRLFPVLMCLVLVVAAVAAMTVASTADNANHASISVDKENVYVGDTITVTFKAGQDKDVTTLTGGIRFDSEYLKCTGVTLAEANGHPLLAEVELNPDSQNEKFRMVVLSTVAEANAVNQVGFSSVGTNEVSYSAADLFVATFEVLKAGTFDVIAYESSYEGINNDEVQTITITANEKPAAGLKGDVNLDGEVTMEDAVLVMKHAIKETLITNNTALANGEVTNDGELTMEDAVKIMKYAIKAIDSLD